MKNKYLSFLLTLLFCLPVRAQETLAELRKGFERQYVECASTPDMSAYDKVAFSVVKLTEVGDMHNYVNSESGLRKIGKIVLPPSLYVIVTGSKTQPGVKMLYWLGPLNQTASKENAMIWKKLQKKYGSVRLNDSIEAIPACWYDGKMVVTSRPDYYGGRLVSAWQAEYTVKQGRIDGYKNKNASWGSLSRDVVNIRKMRHDLFVINEDPNERVWRQVNALNLLARDLSRTIGYEQDKSSRKRYDYTLVVTTDSAHKSHIAALYPDSLNEQDALRIRQLSDAMEQQPAGILGEEWNMDGTPFNVLLIKAEFSEKRGSWVFEEYPRIHFRLGDKMDVWNRGRKGYE